MVRTDTPAESGVERPVEIMHDRNGTESRETLPLWNINEGLSDGWMGPVRNMSAMMLAVGNRSAGKRSARMRGPRQ